MIYHLSFIVYHIKQRGLFAVNKEIKKSRMLFFSFDILKLTKAIKLKQISMVLILRLLFCLQAIMFYV